MRKRLAKWMRRWADRLDHAGAPKLMSWSFTFEPYKGLVFHTDGRGCRLAYLGDEAYQKAFDDTERPLSDMFVIAPW